MATAEQFLLGTLDETLAFDAVIEQLGRLPAPQGAPNDASPDVATRPGALLGRALAGGAEATFQALAAADHARLHAGMSYWWTQGGAEFAPVAYSARGLPDPALFKRMLGAG